RAEARLSRGHWGPAAADLARIMQRHPDNSRAAVEYGAALVLTGKREEYRQLCGRLVRRHRETTDQYVACEVARLCTLCPDAVATWHDGVLVAERAVQAAERAGKPDPAQPHLLHVLGLAYHRAGRPNEALRCLADSEKLNPWCHTLNWLVRALVHHSRGEIP